MELAAAPVPADHCSDAASPVDPAAFSTGYDDLLHTLAACSFNHDCRHGRFHSDSAFGLGQWHHQATLLVTIN